MNNEKMLQFALDTLQNINHKDTETVMVDNTVYDDGSNTISINVTFPEQPKKKLYVDEESFAVSEEAEKAGDQVTIGSSYYWIREGEQSEINTTRI